jgi:putative drug exporter of the RND superfamily
MDTFLVRTLLVPSTVVLLGRWNWWPSRLRMDQAEEAPLAVSGSAAGSGPAAAAGAAGAELR